jgi:hypothetical protein
MHGFVKVLCSFIHAVKVNFALAIICGVFNFNFGKG